jgi:type I restriction enzyme R subunit
VGDPEILADPLFAQAGGFERVDREFDHGLGDVYFDCAWPMALSS